MVEIDSFLPRLHDILRNVWESTRLDEKLEDQRYHDEVEQEYQYRKELMLERM